MKFMLTFFIAILLISFNSFSQPGTDPTKDYFAIESYYKVKWGHADEFISLWKANHYPLLKKALEKGDIISVTATRPRFHSGEETRWDFRVTVVFKTAAIAFDENLTEAYKKLLYPDQESYKKAEQYRFEILLAHWDVETSNDPLP
jgi:hypothetical protein